MASEVLLVSAATTIAAAATYLYLALRLATRRLDADDEADAALRLFAAWWGLTALNQLGASGLYIAAAFGYTEITVQTTYVVAQRLLLAGSMVGLMGYLLFLFRGRTHLVALGIVYGAFYAFQLWSVFARGPDGVVVSRWRTDFTYERTLPAWEGLITLLVLVVPPVVGSLAYLRLAARVPSRSARIRIIAVSIGLVVWWVLAVAAGRAEARDVDALQLANRLVGLLVALGILFAFEPTRWMQRRFAIEPYAARPA